MNRMITEAEGIARFSELDALATLREEGWCFRLILDHSDQPMYLTGSYGRERRTEANFNHDRNHDAAARVSDDGDSGEGFRTTEGANQRKVFHLTRIPLPNGRTDLARWCRLLSTTAARLASEIEPAAAARPAVRNERSAVRAPGDMVTVHRFPGGQPFAVEVHPNATAIAQSSIKDHVTSIFIKEPNRLPLTIILPEEVARQVYLAPTTDAGRAESGPKGFV